MTNEMVPLTQLREQAIALRRAGKSRREIKKILQINSNWRLNESLRGEPPLPGSRRPNAKDDLRAQARELRDQGLAYDQIVAELGVSKSSVSLWVRDLPRQSQRPSPRLSYEQSRELQAAGVARYWAEERVRREAARLAFTARAASEIGEVTDREILIAGAIAYWCEGSKNKPGRPRCDRVVFINSDPAMIKFFMRFLDVVGVDRQSLVFRVQIHETADVVGAESYWLALTRADVSQFRRATLKRHRPSTNRSNVGERYRGCLRIEVRRSTELYRKIDGWAHGVMEPPALSNPRRERPSVEPVRLLKELPGEDSNLG